MRLLNTVPDHIRPVLEPLLADAELKGYARGVAEGKAAGQSELLSGLKALQYLMPGSPANGSSCHPMNLSQSVPAGVEQVTDDDDLDLDGLLTNLFGQGEWSDAERQEIVALAMVAVREAYEARGDDPTDVLARLQSIGGNPAAVKRVMLGHPVWMAWRAEPTRSLSGKYRYKAVGVAEDEGKVAYGADAERKLRKNFGGGKDDPDAETVSKQNAEHRDARDKAHARVAEVAESLAKGVMLKPKEWEEFTGQLPYLTGDQLKGVRRAMIDRLMQKVKGGARKADRMANLTSAIQRVVKYGITRSFQEDYDKGGLSMAAAVKSMGGIDPTDHEFLRHFGSANEARQYGVTVKPGGRSLDDLAGEMVSSGHLVVADGQDKSQALVDALMRNDKSADSDDSEAFDRAYEQHAAQQEYDAVSEADTGSPATDAASPVDDDSFDFGANVEADATAPNAAAPEPAPVEEPVTPSAEPASVPEQPSSVPTPEATVPVPEAVAEESGSIEQNPPVEPALAVAPAVPATPVQPEPAPVAAPEPEPVTAEPTVTAPEPVTPPKTAPAPAADADTAKKVKAAEDAENARRRGRGLRAMSGDERKKFLDGVRAKLAASSAASRPPAPALSTRPNSRVAWMRIESSTAPAGAGARCRSAAASRRSRSTSSSVVRPASSAAR